MEPTVDAPTQTSPPLWRQPDQLRLFGGTMAILLLALAAYLPALSAGFIWDDDAYITDNRNIARFDGLRKIWLEPRSNPDYYPLTLTSFWIEYRLWGLHPFGYHLVNVLLHALNGVLLWRVLKCLGIPAGWVVGVIFVIHPVQVESVAWITERKNTLSGLFYLCAVLSFLKFYFAEAEVVSGKSPGKARSGKDAGEDVDEERLIPRDYLHSIFFYVCAVLAKTVTVSLPAILLVMLWWKRGRLIGRDFKLTIPYFVIGLPLGLFAVAMQHGHTGAMGSRFDFSLADRFLIAGRALWFYASKLVWPAELVFIYPRWNLDPSVFWQWLFPITAGAALIALWAFRGKIGRAPLAATLVFVITLSPALGFFNIYWQVYSYVADHVQYIASIGLLTLIVAGAASLLRSKGRTFEWAGFAVAGAVILILGVLTWRQTHVYRNAETLWRDTIAHNPLSYMAHTNLGHALREEERFEEALASYARALELEPELSDTHFDYAVGLISLKREDEAIRFFEQAIALDPRFAQAYHGIAMILSQRGESDRAVEYFAKAVGKKPDFTIAWFNLAIELEKLGRAEEAAKAYQAAIESDPDHAMARYNFANLLLRHRQYQPAVDQYYEALRINPNWAEPYFNLGQAFLLQGMQQEALAHFQEAYRLDPRIELQMRAWLAEREASTTQPTTQAIQPPSETASEPLE